MLSMADCLVFSSQPAPMSMEEFKEKPPDLLVSSKRIRVESTDDGKVDIRKPVGDSFKTKLMNMASPNNWSRFCAEGEIKDRGRDITFSEGPNGLAMKLYDDLKNQLYKP
ncbi:hypothetical protein ACOSQ4_031297 [Xanthoceras sorbifolium]